MIVSQPRREADQGRMLRDALGVLRRRRNRVIVCTLGAALLAAAHLTVRTTRYTAEAVLALDARKVQVLPLDTVVSRLPQESPVLRTELDVIASRGMAERVLEKLGEAAPPDAERSLRSRLFGTSDAAIEDPGRRDAVDDLLDGLRVTNDGRSFTIVVAYNHVDPVRAAAVANAFAEVYLEQITAAQTSATRDAGEWLGRRLDALRRRLETSENGVQAFRRSAGLLEAGGTTLQEQRLNALTAELAAARTARAAAEARFSAALDPTGGDVRTDLFDGPALQALRRDLAAAERALDEIERSGALKSPDIPALRHRVASIGRQIVAEIARMRGALADEAEIARRKESDLAAAAAEAERELGRVRAAGVQLDQLEREARADRMLYESFLNRYKQTVEQEGLSAPEARIISRAEPPHVPSTRRLPVAVLALGAGAGLGVALAFLQERLDRRIRSVRRLEEETGVAVVGELPEPERGRGAPQLLPVTEPGSAYADAVRRLVATLDCPRNVETAKIVTVTSVERQDGRTTLAVALARSLAAAGRRVIAVEADAVSPQLAAAFGAIATTDLAAVARDRFTPEDVIRPDPKSGACFVGAGPSGGSPGVLVDTEGFARLIDHVKRRFDVVILDAPSMATAGEALPAAEYADAVLLVARWKRTGLDAAATAVRRLALTGVEAFGFVLTGCDADVEASGGPVPVRFVPAAAEAKPHPLRPAVAPRGPNAKIPRPAVAARGPLAEKTE